VHGSAPDIAGKGSRIPSRRPGRWRCGSGDRLTLTRRALHKSSVAGRSRRLRVPNRPPTRSPCATSRA